MSPLTNDQMNQIQTEAAKKGFQVACVTSVAIGVAYSSVRQIFDRYNSEMNVNCRHFYQASYPVCDTSIKFFRLLISVGVCFTIFIIARRQLNYTRR